MADEARARRLAVRIREIVADTLERQVKDPRLGMVTITSSKLTSDLREATVFYTVYGTAEEKAASAAALESAKGVLRSTVGKRTGVRYTPSLTFVADEIPEHAATIDDLLAKARAADSELARSREGKSFAGESDPYRHAEDDEDSDGAS
ncbi:MAG: 30S ribosome-binding factor RbfA [Cumulibacter sp.]